MHVGDSSSQGPTPNRWISESDRSRKDDAESIDEAHRSSTSQCGDGFLRIFSSRNAEASRTASRAENASSPASFAPGLAMIL